MVISPVATTPALNRSAPSKVFSACDSLLTLSTRMSRANYVYEAEVVGKLTATEICETALQIASRLFNFDEIPVGVLSEATPAAPRRLLRRGKEF